MKAYTIKSLPWNYSDCLNEWTALDPLFGWLYIVDHHETWQWYVEADGSAVRGNADGPTDAKLAAEAHWQSHLRAALTEVEDGR